MNISDLAHRIRTRRRTLDLDQKGLAEIAGVSVHALSDLESGKGNPTLEMLNRVAEALGMEVTLRLQTRENTDEIKS
jgi:transcriptional regulator with XRE-family HTH domain